MSTIGILDDRPEEAQTTRSIISRNLRDASWSVVDIPLLPTPGRVVEWLTDNQVNVLIVDQKLNESAGNTVTYSGHEVIQEVRRRLPDTGGLVGRSAHLVFDEGRIGYEHPCHVFALGEDPVQKILDLKAAHLMDGG